MKKTLLAIVAALAIGLFPNSGDGRARQGKERDAKALEAHFINVGYGDAALVKTPEGKNILIDCGNQGNGNTVVSYLKSHGVGTIDMLVVSHPDSDHIGGCPKVINSFTVTYIYDNGMPDRKNSQTFRRYDAARKKAGHYSAVLNDTTMQLEPFVEMSFIVPYDNGGIIKQKRDNNNSLMVKITAGNGSLSASYLFAGDCEEECEQRVLDDGLGSGVLKVSHHGGRYASSSDFLAKVTPYYAIISVGTNVHGHPTPEAIGRLGSAGAKILETIHGNVVCSTSSRKGLACRYE